MALSEQTYVHILWAASDRYGRANLVAAFSDGLADAMVEEYDARVEEAKEWFLGFGDESDGPWTFWTTVESVPRPSVPERVADDG